MSEPLCGKCTLGGDRVPGEGCMNSPLIAFVGEAPGYHETREGRPFVGMAGKVIRGVIQRVGIPQDKVYFTNVCLCRPPENRNPSAEEIKCCWPRLEGELLRVNPKIIVTLGAVPGRVLLPGYTLGDHRGRITSTLLGIPGLLTYHPAAALYPKGSTIFPYILRDVEKVWRHLNGVSPSPELSNPDTEVVVISSTEDMEYLVQRLNEFPERTLISFDWETTGTKPHRDVGFCLGISWKPGTAVVIPDKFIRIFAPQLSEALKRHELTGFNCTMFDSKFNAKLGLPDYISHDAMLMHYALDERPQKRSLENVTVDELDAHPYETEMLAKYKCSKDEMLEKVPHEVVHVYCGRDADWSLRLTLLLKERLDETPTVYSMYRSLLMPAARAFAEIQEHGVWVDRKRLEEVTEEYRRGVEDLEDSLGQLTGKDDFNPRSSKQVQEFLWDELKLEEPAIYGRKPRSADAKTLETLLEAHPDDPFLVGLRDYRKAYTLYSRYLRDMPDYIDPDGRVRAKYHLDRTETGRLSTTDPAIHQTPREGKIRSIFGAPPGFVLLQADYSQVEMRMAAHCAGDKELAGIFQELEEKGADIHTYMASMAFRVPLGDVTKDQRQAAKVFNFGLLYGMSLAGLAARLGISTAEAAGVMKRFRQIIPGVIHWMEHVIERQVREKGYVETIFGRRRRFPLLTDQNLSEIRREAVNTPIQSASSDLTLTKVIELHGIFKRYYPEVRIVIMVHDEIDIECPEPLVPQVAPLVKKVMETPPFETSVPFPVEVVVGTHWGEGEIYGG